MGASFLATRRVFVIVLALGLFAMAARSVTDPDVWWHLRTGQLIAQNHIIPHADPYSFTRFGQPWVDHEWLSQLVIYEIYQTLGWGGLIAAFAAVIAAGFLIMFQRCPGRPYVAGMFTVWGALASVPCWGVRPQMLTLLLASLTLFVLEGSYARPHLLFWLPPIFFLWVNLHAGYPVGLAFVGIFLVGDALDRALGQEEITTTRLRHLAVILVAGGAVIPLNPYGTRMYWYPLETLHSRAMQAYIGEWLSPDFHQHRYLPTLLMMLASLALPVFSHRRLRAKELLLLAVTTYMALRSVRHIPIYMLVAVPLLSGIVHSTLRASSAKNLFDPPERPLTRVKLALNLVLVLGIAAFMLVRLQYVIGRQPRVEAETFPTTAAEYLLANRPPGPMFNHYNWGGYFIWKLYPDFPVYIDGRADVYGDSFLDNFAASYYLQRKNWKAPLETWGIRTVVLPPDSPLTLALRTLPEWTTAFADKQAVVLIRSN